MAPTPIIVSFGNDLRLRDNRALAAAIETGAPVIPVYVLDTAAAGAWAPGGASRWWLHGSLAALAESLSARGSRLVLRRGDLARELARLAQETGAKAVHLTRRYEPWASAQEARLKRSLDAIGVDVKRYGGALLVEPESVRTQAGEPFRVFTPFWRAASAQVQVRPAAKVPDKLPAPKTWPASERLEDWGLLPAKPDWAAGLRASWTPGEAGAEAALDDFIAAALRSYKEDRDRPDRPGTSRLSPHLHFGEIAPTAVWQALTMAQTVHPELATGAQKYLAEIGWREFSAHLLVQFPALPDVPFRRDFQDFPWADDEAKYHAWTRGATGYPIVDAGMRQLRQTGWMHNRVRMVAASFLVKHLLVGWQRGQAWFWDNLVDADLASNAAGWQWVAGCGADAAPYFRVFNPILQGQKFDPDGSYVSTFLPELARLPTEHIHEPWAAPPLVLAAAGVRLGTTYPQPIVDHAEARKAALEAYAKLRANSASR